MRKSVILLELIFVIVLLSIIFLTTTKFIFAIYDKNKSNYTTNLTKIEFESTRLFLINLLKEDRNLNSITYLDNKIYFNDNILQDNVTSFSKLENNGIYTINICVKLHNNICQKWVIK